MSYIPRLKKDYKDNATKAIMDAHSLSNIMEVPKLKKIVISKGVGAADPSKYLWVKTKTLLIKFPKIATNSLLFLA